MKFIKSMSKRTLALILALMMMLSSGIIGAVAANVELAPTGVDHTGGYIYFLKPSTWTESTVMMFIGKDSYTSVYTMTKVSNTNNLYRYTCPSWSGATYIAFANASSAWGDGSWGPSNRTNATHYTNVYNNYQFNSGGFYLWKPASTSNNAGITPYYESSAANLNLKTVANVYSTTADGTTYSSNASAGTVSISGYYMSAYSTNSTRSAVSSTSSSASASTTLTPGSTATFTATAKDGYEFEGWYSSATSTTALSTSATYTYQYGLSYTGGATTANKTVYAKFREVVTDVTATFYNYDGTTKLGESTVAPNEVPTAPTAPTRTGYTFTGWSTSKNATTGVTTLPAISANVTYYAAYKKNTYAVNVTVNNSDWGSAEANPTTVEHGDQSVLTATANDGYNFSYWEKDGVQVSTDNPLTVSDIQSIQNYEAVFVEKSYCYVTIEEIGYTGSYTFGNLNPESDGRYKLESGTTVQLTVSLPTNSTYYISSIDSNTYEDGTLNKTVNYTITSEETKIKITYAERDKCNVTVVNDDENMGSLNKSTTEGIYYNSIFEITPTANDGFQFKEWEVVGPSTYTVAADGTLTLTVKGDTTVTAKWEKKTNFTVTLKAPASMGWASGSGTDANLGAISLDTKADTATLNSADVSAGTVLTFTANTWDDPYVFDKWDIQGNYTNATQNGSTLTLTANGEVTVTANFKTGNLTIYATNVPSNWSQSKLYCYYSTGNGNAVFEMSYDSSKSMWYTTVPDGLTWIKFMDQGQDNATNSKQIDKNPILNGDIFNINAGTVTAGSVSSNAPTTYQLTGGVSLKLENYGDGNHIGSIEIPAGNPSITVNPYGSDNKYWNFYRNYSGTSVEIREGSATAGTPVTINLGENANGVTLDVSFNPSTQTFSWTVTQMKATVNITVNYGMNQNEADPHDGQDIAKTYYRVDGEIVYSFTEGNGNVAKIAEGEMATVYTEIYASAYQNGKPIHRVEGWVLDGVEFIPASSNDGKTFYGTYKYTKDAEITPIFFHTDEWLTNNNVSTVTVYAVLDTLDDTTPDHEIEEWQQGISSYTWFYPSSSDPNSKYCQFDTWTGQYMIPVGNNVFKTYVETKGASGPDYEERSFNGLDISGITFTNVMKATQDTKDWVQAYDYYEFKSLIDDGRFNITYVLRNHNTNVNKGDFTTGTGSTINKNNFQWMNYIDYSGYIMDIYRNVTKTKSTTTPDNTLYILREGPYKVDDGKANGEFYLYSNVYDANGNYIDRCLTYELVDPESDFFTILKNKEAEIQKTYPTFTYVGGNVQISYEAENDKDYNGYTQATRFDGEWYGDLTDTTKVDINVLVGFTEDNGTTIDVKDTNANNYGTATVNGKAEDEVTRGSYATLLASEKTGYKFIGWYNTKKDGDTVVATTLLTKDYTIDVEASVAATYVAVYRTRTGGEFDVLNLKYAGDTSDPSVPFAHGGESYRYVSVVHTHVNGTTSVTNYDKQANGVSIPNVTEGDMLEITIYTDAFYPEDYFYAWYMEVRDSSGKIVNFEEVGVDKSHVGSKEEVSFTFEYVVKQGDNGITIYSDIYHKEITKDIIYLYQDRYNNTKQYIKSKYTLVGDELITGVPSEETIIKYAPWVEDLYKDTQWIFDEEKFTEDSWTLVATQAPTVYTVNVYTGMNRKQFTGVYDTPVEVLATAIDPNATNNGYWYEDCGNVPGSYDSGDKILAYGAYYGLLIKKNVDIGYYYSPELELDFKINLDEPIYGREQSGVDGAIDKIFVDYHTSVHVPYFKGNTLLNGNKITDVYYEGETFVSANSPVTLETLEKFGYEVEYGIITEQVGTFKIEDGAYADFATAQNAAIAEGYQSATTSENLEKVVASDLTKGWGKSFGINSVKKGTSDEYYTVYTLTDEDFISNKNRFPFTLVFNNTSANRGRFYNVYGYIALTYTPVGSTTSVTDYYFSNMQTLNFHEAGTNTSAAYNNN